MSDTTDAAFWDDDVGPLTVSDEDLAFLDKHVGMSDAQRREVAAALRGEIEDEERKRKVRVFLGKLSSVAAAAASRLA